MKTFWKTNLNKTCLILCGISAIASVVFGLVRPPFFLNLINALTVIGAILLLIGFFRYIWKHGDLIIFSYRTYYNVSYQDFRNAKIEERRDLKNPALAAGVIVFTLAVVFTIIYSI